MAKFLEHLDHHTKDLFQSTKEVLDENLPIIYNSLATVKSFISLLGKIIRKVPHEIDPISGEITLKCKGCLLHYPQNWSPTDMVCEECRQNTTHGRHDGGGRARGQGSRSSSRHHSKTPSQKGWTRFTHGSPPNTLPSRYPGVGELFSPSLDTTPKLSSAVSVLVHARSSHSAEGVTQTWMMMKTGKRTFRPHTLPCIVWSGESKVAKVNQLPSRWRPQEEVRHGGSWPAWTSVKRSLRH